MTTIKFWIILILIMIVAMLAASAGERSTSVSILRIVDGDTMVVFDGNLEMTVRLAGVDVPEASVNDKAIRDAKEWHVDVMEIVDAGRYVTDYVKSTFSPGSTVKMIVSEPALDDYDRVLAYIVNGEGIVLNELLVEFGLALAPTYYRHTDYTYYRLLEIGAKNAEKNFWGTIWRNIR